MPGGSRHTSQPDVDLPDLDLEKCPLEQRVRRHETQHQQHDGQQHQSGLQKRHGSQQQNAPKQDGSHASSDDPGSANTKVEKTSKQEQPKQSVFEAPPVEDINPAADRIATDDTSPLTPDHFYELMGLQQPRSAEELNTKLRKLALHNGLYKTIWNELQWIQVGLTLKVRERSSS